MTNELTNLARRAVACKGWRWMPGMMRLRDTPPNMRDFLKREGRVPDSEDNWLYQDWRVLPDLTDPATVGCLLMLVREVWKDRCACVLSIDYGPAGEKWVVRLTVNGRSLTERHWDTEIEALVAALEVAS